MSEELKVQIPDGYRWVEMNEERTGKWLYQCAGVWRESQDQHSNSDWYYITPILPPKPPQDWLDKHGVELTGECRVVNHSETGSVIFAFADGEAYRICENSWISTPAWILRKKAPPETVDVEIKTDNSGWLKATNPNNDCPYNFASMPCIVGPEWAFAGFVWGEGGPEIQHYYLVDGDRVKYAKSVRFRRVGGAK